MCHNHSEIKLMSLFMHIDDYCCNSFETYCTDRIISEDVSLSFIHSLSCPCLAGDRRLRCTDDGDGRDNVCLCCGDDCDGFDSG